jgi:alpha-maltose-1-phosphate synthase
MSGRILFLNQGRAVTGAAMGHARVDHAVRAGLAAMDEPPAADFVALPPFSLAERIAVRPLKGLGHGDFATLRFHLARGVDARRAIRHALRAAPPDVVHITTVQVSFLLREIQRAVPCVLSLDTTIYDWIRLLRRLPDAAGVPFDLRPLLALERRALHRAPLCVGWTKMVTDRIRAIAPRARCATLHPGIDLTRYRPATAARSRRLKVLFVGGRWKAKGGDDLLAALGDDLGRTVEVEAVTPGPLPSVRGLTRHDAAPGADVVLELLRRADVLCLPSYVDAVPWAIVEALACGVPVVATRVGSIAELAGPGGLIVEPGDVAGLREALQRVLESSELRRGLGEAGRAHAEQRYDALSNTRRLVDMLLDVAAERAANTIAG